QARVRRSGVSFGNMRKRWRLRTIDCSGADHEEPACAVRRREIERPSGTIKGRHDQPGGVRVTMTTGNGNIRGCVDHEGKFPLRKGKGPHISVEEGDCGVIGKMGTGVPKPCRITRKD